MVLPNSKRDQIAKVTESNLKLKSQWSFIQKHHSTHKSLNLVLVTMGTNNIICLSPASVLWSNSTLGFIVIKIWHNNPHIISFAFMGLKEITIISHKTKAANFWISETFNVFIRSLFLYAWSNNSCLCNVFIKYHIIGMDKVSSNFKSQNCKNTSVGSQQEAGMFPVWSTNKTLHQRDKAHSMIPKIFVPVFKSHWLDISAGLNQAIVYFVHYGGPIVTWDDGHYTVQPEA